MKPRRHEVVETLKAVFQDLENLKSEADLMDILKESTNHNFSMDDVIADYIKDSLDLMQLLADIEERFNIVIKFNNVKEITPQYLLGKIKTQ